MSLFIAIAAGFNAGSADASDVQQLNSLMDLSLTELSAMPVTVTSVSKRPEALGQAASAVYVIDQEAIRRSAATSVPEALRMVPGLEVARIDASKWAITARGGNHEFANKLLVMIDGRSVYTPMFGGVYWDAQTLPLRDVDRIEVIRGPGASLWGANAMNGVINIITRSSEETQSGVVAGFAGNKERLASLRQGVAIGDQTFLRVWGHGQETDSLKRKNGLEEDNWTSSQIGFRLDSRQGRQRWEMDGKIYQGRLHDISVLPQLTAPYTRLLNDEVETAGGHVRLRWERPLTATQNLSVQTYFDQTERERDFYEEKLRTVDVEIQHDWTITETLQWQWGANVRHSWDELDTQSPFQFPDERGESRLQSLFAQLTQWVADGRGKLVLGSKFSHTNRSGTSLQPNLRASWSLNPDHMIWGSVSRAVRTPTRYETDSRYDALAYPDPTGSPLPVLNQINGDGGFSEEELTAYEMGLRNQIAPSLSLDTAVFFNQYQNLMALESGDPYLEFDPQPTHVVMPFRYINYSDATSYGLESALDWTPLSNWRLGVSYSYLRIDPKERPAPGVTEFTYLAQYSPRHQVKLRSFYNFARHWELDALVYYTDELGGTEVDAYTRFDLRLGWNPLPELQLSVGGKNLLDSHHQEFVRSLVAVPSEVVRSFYVNAAYAF